MTWEETITRYQQLCVAGGCHTTRELTSWLATERKTRPGVALLPASHVFVVSSV